MNANSDTTEVESLLEIKMHPILVEQFKKIWPDLGEEDFPDLLFWMMIRPQGITPRNKNILYYSLKDIPDNDSDVNFVSKEDDTFPDYLHPVEISSLRALFRGNFDPGELHDTDDPKYMYLITSVERGWIEAVQNDLIPVPTDSTMLEIYSQLARRPDGKILSCAPLFDIIWQYSVNVLARLEFSQAEYTACMRRLARSARTFQTSLTSTNMYDYISPVYE